MQKLSFQNAIYMCEALGTYAEAIKEDQESVRLVVKQMKGRKVLHLEKIESIFSKTSNWFTSAYKLYMVVKFLQKEPYFPDFEDLDEKQISESSFTKNALKKFQNMGKKEYKELLRKKNRGIDALCQTLSRYNRNARFPIYFCPQQLDKERLSNLLYYNGIICLPQPMGTLDPQKIERIRDKYIPLKIENDQFGHLDPFFLKRNVEARACIIGFSYEYGLGAKPNRALAIECYEMDQGEYSSAYNLGRLRMEDGNFQESKKCFVTAKKLMFKIHKKLKQDPFSKENKLSILVEKDLSKTMIALIELKLRIIEANGSNIPDMISEKKKLYQENIISFKKKGFEHTSNHLQRKCDKLDGLEPSNIIMIEVPN